MFTPVASYLRVYEPVSAFSDEEYWRQYVSAGRGFPVWEGPTVMRELLYSKIGWPWRDVPDFPREAYVLAGDEPKICPWNLTYRMAHVAVELASMLPGALGERLFPSEFTSSASDIVAADMGADRHQAPSDTHERISIWTIPLRWLLCMRAVDKRHSLDSGSRYLLYRAPISVVRSRMAVALSIVRGHEWEDVDLPAAVESTMTWLQAFDSQSTVELDFGGLSGLLSDSQLAHEDSVELAWSVLEAANDGNADLSQKLMDRLNTRLKDIRSKERLN